MTKLRTIPALLAATLSLGASAVWADAPGQDMQKQIDALQAQIAELKATQATAPTYSQKDVEAAVDSVLRDADKRTNLLAETSSFYGGYVDDKFSIRSADGNFSMSPGVQFQYRYATNWRDNAKSQGGSDTQSGYEVRRLKFSLDGNFLSNKLYYNFVWATNRSDTVSNVGGGGTGTFGAGGGSLVLEEAYVRYQFADNFAVKAGSYKEQIYQETGTSSKRKLAVDNSIVGEYLFGGDIYTQGVDLMYDDGPKGAIQADLAFSDGYGSRNTDFRDPSTNAFDFGVHGRVNYKVMGDWKSYSDQTALGNKTDLLVIGAGFDWSQNGDSDVVRWAVDAQYETGKLGILAAVTGRYTRTAGGGDDINDYGFLIQAGYLVNTQLEVYGRYAMLALDSSGVTSGDTEFCELTVGANYYLKGHSAKFTVDVGWLPNGSPANLTGADILANPGEDQVYIRAQFQLLL